MFVSLGVKGSNNTFSSFRGGVPHCLPMLPPLAYLSYIYTNLFHILYFSARQRSYVPCYILTGSLARQAQRWSTATAGGGPYFRITTAAIPTYMWRFMTFSKVRWYDRHCVYDFTSPLYKCSYTPHNNGTRNIVPLHPSKPPKAWPLIHEYNRNYPVKIGQRGPNEIRQMPS